MLSHLQNDRAFKHSQSHPGACCSKSSSLQSESCKANVAWRQNWSKLTEATFKHIKVPTANSKEGSHVLPPGALHPSYWWGRKTFRNIKHVHAICILLLSIPSSPVILVPVVVRILICFLLLGAISSSLDLGPACLFENMDANSSNRSLLIIGYLLSFDVIRHSLFMAVAE